MYSCIYYPYFNDFKNIKIFEELTDNLDFKVKYDILIKKYLEINAKLNDFSKVNELELNDYYLNNVFLLAKKVDKNKRELFLTRVKPIVKMINSEVY